MREIQNPTRKVIEPKYLSLMQRKRKRADTGRKSNQLECKENVNGLKQAGNQFNLSTTNFRRTRAMYHKSEKSIELYHILLDRGYPEPFCDEVTKNLNTDFTATWMIRYLSHYQKPPLEDLVDEMLGILEQRNRIVEKKKTENYNQIYNEYLNSRSYNEEED